METAGSGTDASDSGKSETAVSAKTGTLTVRSVPEGARVFLDERNLGETPLSLYGVPVGRYELSLSMPFFFESVRAADVVDGIETEVSLELSLDPNSPEIQGRLIPAWKPSVAAAALSIYQVLFANMAIFLDPIIFNRFLVFDKFYADIFLKGGSRLAPPAL